MQRAITENGVGGGNKWWRRGGAAAAATAAAATSGGRLLRTAMIEMQKSFVIFPMRITSPRLRRATLLTRIMHCALSCSNVCVYYAAKTKQTIVKQKGNIV